MEIFSKLFLSSMLIPENTTSYERLKKFINLKYDGNLSKFCTAIGMSSASLDVYRRRNTVIPHKYRDKVESLGLNWKWYEFGTGEMLRDNDNNGNTGDVHENFKLVIKNIDKLSMAEIKEFIQAARNMSEEMVS